MPWDELVDRSNFLSPHVPQAEATPHLVDREVLRRMTPGAVLVNGPVVDERALVEALRGGDRRGPDAPHPVDPEAAG